MKHINQTLTFYRKMANTNTEIMKQYKSAVINRMTFNQIADIYIKLNLKFDEDIERLLKFNKFKKVSYFTGIKPSHLIYGFLQNYLLCNNHCNKNYYKK
jgi:hypothetical protein